DRDDVIVVQVRGDLDQHRYVAAEPAASLGGLVLDGFEHRSQHLDGLQVPQAGGVGAGDVDGQVAGIGSQGAGGEAVVLAASSSGVDFDLPMFTPITAR